MCIYIYITAAKTHLQKEKSLGGLLDELFRDILREKLGPKFEQQRALLPHVLGRHLEVGGYVTEQR